MSYTTDRLALPLPDGNDGPQGPDVPYWFNRLGLRLEETVVSFDQGALSARPRAGRRGRVYFANDSGVIYFDDGTSWRTTTGTGAVQVVGAAGAPAFTGGWQLTDATRPVRFWKDGPRVHLAGGARPTSSATSSSIFRLPEGYRPRYVYRLVLTYDLLYTMWGIHYRAEVVVRPDGFVMFETGNSASVRPVSFDGLSFDLER